MKKLSISLLLLGIAVFGSYHDICAQSGKSASKTITTTKLEGIETTFEQTESSSLSPGYELLVNPLVASMEVFSTKGSNGEKVYERATFTGSARTNIPKGLKGNEYLGKVEFAGRRGGEILMDMETLKAQVIFDFCRETGADLIVFPQFNIYQKMQTVNAVDSDGKTIQVEEPVIMNDRYVMIVEAVGFPARFTDFRQSTPVDEWIKHCYKLGENENNGTNITDETTDVKVK